MICKFRHFLIIFTVKLKLSGFKQPFNKRLRVMFRKLWKTLKFFLILGIVLICLPHSILPKQNRDINKEDLEYYINLNNTELRLAEYKDNEEAIKLKIRQLEIINHSRRKYNAGPVRLDILASRVANKICKEAVQSNFLGHWNMAGEKPYQRYAFAGGYDHISENAFGEWSTGNYTINEATISSRMRSGHATFMAEKPPYDGHKKNITGKTHNFVGIGFDLTSKQFRYYEEFIDRYFDFENIPSEVKVDEPFNITVKTKGESFLYYLVVYFEPFPRPMNAKEISKRGSYQDFTDEEYIRMAAWDLSGLRSSNEYKIPLKFSREGLYYIQIYSDSKEITKPSSLSTTGKVPYSGIVIKAHK